MSNLIDIGTTEVTSPDFSVVAGTPKSLFIKSDTDGALRSDVNYVLQHKSSGGIYNTVAVLNAGNITELGTITGAGTFRVQREPLPYGSGVITYSSGMDIE